MDVGIRGEEARDLAEHLLRTYFKTQDYPYTRHHIESYDQFLSQDIPAMIKAKNPLILLQNKIGDTGMYEYRAEIYVGGVDGSRLYVGTPTVTLKDSEEVRVMFPNEARLRNLTYAATVEADIVVKIQLNRANPAGGAPITTELILDPEADPTNYGYLARFPLFRIPIMLHSRYCLLHGKPQEFLKEVGECQYDFGGYFIVGGSEKILITHQEQAFNTLYITPQERDPKIALYASISCLNPKTREVRRVSLALMRKQNTLLVSLPFTRKPVSVFILFRALGIQSDEDILRLIFPDPESAETKMLEPMLRESILEAFPFYDTYSAVQYIKVLTKGFSEAHVLDILYNQLFIHVENRPKARATFLAECVRRILRVHAGLDARTDRDDTRNQRCMTSGILTRMLFQGCYDTWAKKTILNLDEEYKFHPSTYENMNFLNLFTQGTLNHMFNAGMMTENLMRAYKGKWTSGSGAGVGEEKSGVMQALSRLSYMDFMSHCRRVVLDFDTGMKLASPRRLHTSQYGYFCTNETPNGASIGITKNLSMLTAISVASDPSSFVDWLFTRGGVIPCADATPQMVSLSVPVFLNNGIVGYTLRPPALRDALKVLKWVGSLPATCGVGFSVRDRRVFIFMDEGRPMRPLIHLGPNGAVPVEALRRAKTWRDLVLGVAPEFLERGIYTIGFVDPLAAEAAPTLEDYVARLAPQAGVIEYLDPYEMNEVYIANFPEYIRPETTHMEIHPSTIVGLLTSMIPYANHNQSPRNQLSCSQSKQGIAVYSTAYPLRYDNQVHVLCYPQAPIARTLYYDYLADGQMGYGANLILAMGSFTGYNQDDGIVMNADTVERGMFRSTCYRTYEAYEEDDEMTGNKTRIANPAQMPGWTALRAGVDYTNLDERGIVRVGTLVDETSVLVGRYLQSPSGSITDASVTAQVWTRGRVENVSVTTDNQGFVMVKVRVVQERLPELGDKFSNRHGQKGTIGMLIRGYDMPRRRDGIAVDMIMNPHAIPSRMTVAQLLEALVGKAAPELGATANCTLFMNEGSPVDSIGKVLRDQLGMEPLGEELLYDGMSGQFVPSKVFIGSVYTMRLKHMPEDKWNARAEGRREQRTHQPTGGRGAQGGLRIGEMDRDAILGHGVADFIHESMMKRSDGYETYVCDGCGTIPIYNEKEGLFLCSMCDGPLRYIGDSATNLEILPPTKRSQASFSKVAIPYAAKLLDQELTTYLNMGSRILTAKALAKLRGPALRELTAEQQRGLLEAALPERVLPETVLPEFIPQEEEQAPIGPEDLGALGALPPVEEEHAAAEAAGPAAGALPPGSFVVTGLPGLAPAGEGGNAAAAAAAGPGGNVPAMVLQAANTPAGPVSMAAPAEGGLAAGVPPPPLPAPADNSFAAAGLAAASEGLGAAGAAPPPAAGTVQVQTTNQPVLVVPVNVSAQQQAAPAPTEMVTSGLPGAPATLAVDTSPSAMARTGLPPLPGPAGRNRSGSPGNRNGAGAGAPPPGTRVSVNKVGASSGGAAAAGPGVKVTVNKSG